MNYDRIAPWYGWLELLAFGNRLRRCRHRFLAEVSSARRALVVGEGEGHFVAALLARNPRIEVTAVDVSAVMLARLEARVRRMAPGARVECVHADVRDFVPARGDYDLVATHFVLDCLDTAEIERVGAVLAPALAADARWVLSEFVVPRGSRGVAAKVLVRTLYEAQRIATGLRRTQLPSYAPMLRGHGFVRTRSVDAFFGMARAELWSRGSGAVRS